MNWLNKIVPPRIRDWVRKKDVPSNLWQSCPACQQMIHHKDIAANLNVCPSCGHHLRLSARERFASLFDEGRYQAVETPVVVQDPLKFKDSARYVDRLKTARNKGEAEGLKEALAVATGKMGGRATVIAVQDFGFMGGSMGLAVGAAFLAAARQAVSSQAPLIAVTASGGARMQEGILSLMQMPRTTIAVQELREAGLPYIVVLTDPTTGGVTASYAMLGDIHIAEPGAQIGFAGPRVIEKTIREQLPEGFQRAEYLLEHGMVDMVVPRHRLRPTLISVIDMLMRPKADVPRLAPPAEGHAAA
ncbi:MAG: acetyl-CoA carboxylase carboxyltransferase subunit beta [Alphaproteobacteria bacterium]|nr:acetyl-CoA carboxylase carboxyltransferase subunit beta [Alphaproteobacteria bacterium]